MNEGDFELAISWEQAAYRHRGPYPPLVLAGEQGTGKTTLSSIMRMPAPLRALPREDRDLFIAANNGHVLAFDNVSGLPRWISDTLCRLATGGGFAVRQLYTDQDEVLFDAQRPIILNGIEDIVERPDLADRSLFLHLEPIKDRKTESEMLAAFGKKRPGIMGVILDSVAHGIKHYSQASLDGLPRMADFALWGSACETALWKKGTFMAAYAVNIKSGVETVIEADLVAGAIIDLMGTTKELPDMSTAGLLATLTERVGEKIAKQSDWPKTPHALSGRLRRIATAMRKMGIGISRLPRKNQTRPVRIARLPDYEGNSMSPKSQMSRSQSFQGLGRDDSGDDANAPDGNVTGNVTENPLKTNDSDIRDESDVPYPPNSGADPFAHLRDRKYGLQPKETNDE